MLSRKMHIGLEVKCIWCTKVPDSASPFQDWNRMSSQSKQVIISQKYVMNDNHLGALSTSSSTTSGAKHPWARNCFKKLPFYTGSVTWVRASKPTAFVFQSMASSCPQPFSVLKVQGDSKRPRWCLASPVNKPLISPLTGISVLGASWNTLSR